MLVNDSNTNHQEIITDFVPGTSSTDSSTCRKTDRWRERVAFPDGSRTTPQMQMWLFLWWVQNCFNLREDIRVFSNNIHV